ncbi:MAG: DUF3365 domain-containing protein [Candidatus Competibacteraceae bacterium]|nr:DUF3365 domain-containing protein [Candidatus Competibacteraceae bacterium]
MRYAPILALGAVLFSAIALPRQQQPTAGEPDALPEKAVQLNRAVMQKFSDTLKETLQQAVQNGGPASGMVVCRDKASQIATELSTEANMIVGRTSLKLRNPNNAPDNWELAVLKQFDARHAQGESAEKLEFFAIIDDDQGQKTLRYMKAIPTTTLCLSCHGENINPEVDAKLNEWYPNDKARGYQEGELRGAFTLATPLP